MLEPGFVLSRALSQALEGSIAPGDRIGIACSGGADSMALVRVAHALWGGRVVLLHVDHGLQTSSTAVATRVSAWGETLGVEVVVKQVKVSPKGSVEAAARRARYRALSQMQATHELAAVLTAHTQRDVAETVLMRMIRGTDLAGLRTIAPRRGTYVRPWLHVARTVIDAYVAEHGLPVWDDPMNDDRALLRARIRHDVMPLLLREHPNVEASLAAVSRQLTSWYRATRPLRRQWWRAAIVDEEGCAPSLRAGEVTRAPEAVGRWVVARWLRIVSGHAATRRHRDAVLAMCLQPEASRLDVVGGMVRKEFDDVVFVPVRGAASTKAADTDVALTPPFEAPEGYIWRHWQAGDRMRPIRLKGRSAKLSDLLAQARIAASARPRAWVLVHPETGEIAWAQHIGRALDAPLVPGM